MSVETYESSNGTTEVSLNVIQGEGSVTVYMTQEETDALIERLKLRLFEAKLKDL